MSSYVTFVLREIISQDKSTEPRASDDAIGKAEKSELLKRLKNLGYI